MVKCTFCGREEESFRGTFVMKNDGSTDYFCSSKCMKNQNKLKRDKRKVKWTESFHLVKGRRLEKEAERVQKSKVKKAAKKASKKAK